MTGKPRNTMTRMSGTPWIADALEQRREMHHVLDDDHVLHAAEAELAVDRVRQVVREVVRDRAASPLIVR